MQTLPSNNIDKTNLPQKAIALLLLVGTIGAVVLGLNAIAPTLITFLQNIIKLTGLAVVIFAGVIVLGIPALYIAQNPLVIWGFYKTITWNFTKFLIKMDPLSVMDRYVDYLKKKLKGLGVAIAVLVGKRDTLLRKTNDLNKNISENSRYGRAALEQGKKAEAGTYGIKIKTDRDTLSLLMPLLDKANRNIDLMQKLEENWSTSIEQLEYQIAGKRAEYEIIKETFKGLKTAEDFINSDNDAAKMYGQSVMELENQVTQKMGYIEEFERKSKGLMSNLSIEKQANMDAGLGELEAYMNDSNLMLPDFSQNAQPVPFTETKTPKTDKKYFIN